MAVSHGLMLLAAWRFCPATTRSGRPPARALGKGRRRCVTSPSSPSSWLLLGSGLRRPFLFVLVYAYIDIVSPQRLSYNLLNTVPISMIFFIACLARLADGRQEADCRVGARQMAARLPALLGRLHHLTADFPVEAAEKWDWAWKALAFAIFLPFTLAPGSARGAAAVHDPVGGRDHHHRRDQDGRCRAAATGSSTSMVDNNSGLYESSTISTLAIALIPIIL